MTQRESINEHGESFSVRCDAKDRFAGVDIVRIRIQVGWRGIGETEVTLTRREAYELQAALREELQIGETVIIKNPHKDIISLSIGEAQAIYEKARNGQSKEAE